MTLQELAERADVTPQTIRFYVSEGLLMPPLHGRPAEYTDEHLAQLEVIKKLKAQYLPLEEIRAILSKATPADVERVLEPSFARTAPRPLEEKAEPQAALDYIRGVLERSAGVNRLKERPGAPSPRAPTTAPKSGFPPETPEPPTFQQAMAGNSISTWHRITVMPGVELHFEGTDPAARSLVARILDLAADRPAVSSQKGTD